MCDYRNIRDSGLSFYLVRNSAFSSMDGRHIVIIGTIEAWQVDEFDSIVIDGEECTVKSVDDEIEHILITYFDAFGEKVSEEFPVDWVFEIWGN